ncbi:UNVERIFIED_CONTAM: hypothetical protein K2H54_064619 [Gekko kuhli]
MFHLSKAIDTSRAVDYWKVVQSSFSLGQPSPGKALWTPVPLTEECSRDSTIRGPLKIVSVHREGKFVRILNNLSNKEVDLSGYIIQQWVGGYPVSIYRFPNGTVLPAQHHITVWAPGANLAQKQPSEASLDSQGFFRAGPECTTILCNCNGQTVSQYTAPHRFTAAAEAYSDNVDLSVDKFPLTDEKEDSLESSCPSKEEVALPAKSLQKEMAVALNAKSGQGTATCPYYEELARILHSDAEVWPKRVTRSLERVAARSGSRAHSTPTEEVSLELFPGNAVDTAEPQPSTSSQAVKESHSSSSDDEYFTSQIWKPSPELPKVRGTLGVGKGSSSVLCRAAAEAVHVSLSPPGPKEFKTTLDTTLPMVALIGQKSARSKYGFKYMSYVPTSTDLLLRRYYYGS